MHRQAQIAKYLNLIFDDVFSQWSRQRGEKMLQIRDWQGAKPDEAEAYLAAIDEAEVLRFSKEPATVREIRNLAFASFKSSEYPTHRMLQELMHLESGRDDVRELSERLLPWCAGGNYGRRFDGASNVSLTGKIAHFELGYIPESAKALRAAVFGNSRQFFLMRQNDRTNLDDIGADISRSDVTTQTILHYPLPDQQPAEKFAAFTYLHTDAVRPVCGTVHNVASPEMLYCSSTTGAHFERRAKQLKGSSDLVQAIVDACGNKPMGSNTE